MASPKCATFPGGRAMQHRASQIIRFRPPMTRSITIKQKAPLWPAWHISASFPIAEAETASELYDWLAERKIWATIIRETRDVILIEGSTKSAARAVEFKLRWM